MLDINYINELLQEGKSVKDIRTILQIGEKSFQKQIKKMNYKYNQKIRQYEPIGEVLCNPMINYSSNRDKPVKIENRADFLTIKEKDTIQFLGENIDLIKQLLNNYKATTSHNQTDIIINLINDKKLNPKPKSVRINEYVWRDWLEFTKDLAFSKSDLISQALIEFMERHKSTYNDKKDL